MQDVLYIIFNAILLFLKDNMQSIMISIITGIISGYISGIWVTRRYRKRDHESLLIQRFDEVWKSLKVFADSLESNDIDVIKDILSFHNKTYFDDIEIRFTDRERRVIANVNSIIDELKRKLVIENITLQSEEIVRYKEKIKDVMSDIKDILSQR